MSKTTPCGDCCASCYTGPWSTCPTQCVDADANCQPPAAALQTRNIQCRRPTDVPTCNPATGQVVADNSPGCEGAQGLRVTATGCSAQGGTSQNCPQQPICPIDKCECTTSPCQGASCGGRGCGLRTTTCTCYRYNRMTNGQQCGTKRISQVINGKCGNDACVTKQEPCDLPDCPTIKECNYGPWSTCPTQCTNQCNAGPVQQTRTSECRAFDTRCNGITKVSDLFTVVATNQCGTGSQGLRVTAPGGCKEPTSRNCPQQALCPTFNCECTTGTCQGRSCGGKACGLKTTTCQCMRTDACGRKTPAAASECKGQTCTSKTEPCDLPECPEIKECYYSPWSQCPGTCRNDCNPLVRTRTKECRSFPTKCDGITKQGATQFRVVQDTECGGQTQGLRVTAQGGCKERLSETCNDTPCPTYECSRNPFTQCGTQCGCRGSRTATAQIMRVTPGCVNGQSTQQVKTPVDTFTCNNDAGCQAVQNNCKVQIEVCPAGPPCCSYSCGFETWGPCSVTCGSGTQTRAGKCQSTCIPCTNDGVTQGNPVYKAEPEGTPGCGQSAQGLRVTVQAKCPAETKACILCPNNLQQQNCVARRRKGVDELNKALYRQAPAAAPTAIAPVSYRESHREQNEEQDNDTVTTVLAAVCGVVAVVALLGSMYMLVHKYVASRADRKAQITNEM